MTGPHSLGEVVGDRYEVVGFVGEGGMQFVYAALDTVLSRTVALKTPKNASALKRFHRSAIVSARVNHPNIAKTLDYFEGERPYLVEELVAGQDLDKALLRQAGYLDPYLVAKILHHMAKGLAASHHAGVVHRDLKPTNVMVVDGFQVSAIKITDFGIAKMADEELAEAAEGGGETLTGSGTAVGALPYMAPEAIETPRSVGPSADIWSLGAMMFELLSGQKPYGAGLKAVAKILSADPLEMPTFVTKNVHYKPLAEKLIEILLECMKRDPAERPNADELVRRCQELCYPKFSREFGRVKNIEYRSWGFIANRGPDVFFHLDSVYGERPSVGDSVMYSTFIGVPASRAHPVVKIKGADPE